MFEFFNQQSIKSWKFWSKILKFGGEIWKFLPKNPFSKLTFACQLQFQFEKRIFLAKFLEYFPEFSKFWSDFPSRDACLVVGFEQSYQTFSKRCSEMSLGNRQAIGLFFKKCIFLVSASLSQFSKSNVRISKISSNVDSVKIPYKPSISVFFEKIRENGYFYLWKWSDFHEIILSRKMFKIIKTNMNYK